MIDTHSHLLPALDDRTRNPADVLELAHELVALDGARGAEALVQVVAPSLTGRWGSAAADAAWGLLEHNRVDLLASDWHRPRRDGKHLARAVERVSRRFGRETLLDLTEDGPAHVVGLSEHVR